MNIKHYMDIMRFKAKFDTAFHIGEEIVVESKIDGANVSLCYNPETNKIEAFSRKTLLNEANNLRGFWEFSQRLDAEVFAQITNNGRYIVFGEWLCPHTVRYPEHMYKHMYVFDVFDTETGSYLPYIDALAIFSALEKMAMSCGEVIYFVPVVYEGPFLSWEHIYSLLSLNTTNAEPCEEGVVVKSQERLNEKENRLPIYIKIVNERFSEVHDTKPKKPIDPEILKAREANRLMVASVATERRTRKILEKMIDAGVIPEDWDESNMGTIAKNIGKLLYEDCMKEEPDIVKACENFGKEANSLAMGYVKEWLKSR